MKTVNLTVHEGLTVQVLPNADHEFLMTTREVAHGYGTSKYAVFKAVQRNEDIIEGKHFIRGVDILSTPNNGTIQENSILFTKRGIVRIGFFIKSERAKLFRDWAEDLIIAKMESGTQGTFFEVPVQKKLPAKRNHNRLTQERLLDIMADVCLIDDKALRTRIAAKIMGDNSLLKQVK